MEPERVELWRERATLILVVAVAIAVPLFVVRDPIDMFRMPKALLLRAEAILLAATTIAAWILGAPLPRPRRPWLWWMSIFAMAGLAVLTLVATNRLLSLEALGTIAATTIVFFATWSVANKYAPVLLAAILGAAVFNAALVIVEEAGLWMPFGGQSGIPHHLQCTALVGNPNEIGGYLGAATLACLALVASRRTAWMLPCAAILAGGLIAAQTLTAYIAFAAAALTMLAAMSWRRAIRIVPIAIAIAIVALLAIAPLRARGARLVDAARAGDYNALLTDRVTPFVAAWMMFTDHPVTGVGPGAFAWQFYDYKLRAEQRFPSLRRAYNRGLNFGEVHNDHLQVLAETGALGYAGFLALFAMLAAISFRSNGLARRLALPLAVFWFVLSIAQFPLETTVVRTILIQLAALCAAERSS
jgi:O-antigen ligase